MRRRARRFVAQRLTGALTTVAVATTIVLVALSPVILSWASSEDSRNPFRSYDWDMLSSIGEAYGAISAILAGLALAAIAGSLALQARQVRISQLQAMRNFQLELFRTAYDHPELQAGWSTRADMPGEEWRLQTYVNMVFAYLNMSFDMRAISEAELRRTLRNRFRGAEARRYWASARHAWATGAQGRRQHRFVAVADSAYAESLASAPRPGGGPPGAGPASGDDGDGDRGERAATATPGARHSDRGGMRPHRTRRAAFTCGVASGALGTAYLIGRRRSRGP